MIHLWKNVSDSEPSTYDTGTKTTHFFHTMRIPLQTWRQHAHPSPAFTDPWNENCAGATVKMGTQDTLRCAGGQSSESQTDQHVDQ